MYKKFEVLIRNVVLVIGLIVFSFLVIEFGFLYYRFLEINKIKVFKCLRGNFDFLMYISDKMKDDLLWWINNVYFVCR